MPTSLGIDSAKQSGPETVASAGRRSLIRTRLGWERLTAIAFIAPAVLIVAAVYLYPGVLTFAYSFTELDVATFTVDRFVGLSNYIDAFRNPAVRGVTVRTIYFGAMVVVLTVMLSFAVAMLLNRPFRGRGLVRVVVLLPWAVPPVVSGVLWGQMFNAHYGFVNKILRAFGGSGDVLWLGEATTALHALIVAEVWRSMPFATLFILAGLQTIPPDLYEAASVDGAGSRQRFRFITKPLMWPVLLPVSSVLFIWAMSVFDTIFVLTRGGPSNGTTTLNYLVYQQSFQQFRFGEAAATAYILSLVTVIVLALLSFPLLRARARAGMGTR